MNSLQLFVSARSSLETPSQFCWHIRVLVFWPKSHIRLQSDHSLQNEIAIKRFKLEFDFRRKRINIRNWHGLRSKWRYLDGNICFIRFLICWSHWNIYCLIRDLNINPDLKISRFSLSKRKNCCKINDLPKSQSNDFQLFSFQLLGKD